MELERGRRQTDTWTSAISDTHTEIQIAIQRQRDLSVVSHDDVDRCLFSCWHSCSGHRLHGRRDTLHYNRQRYNSLQRRRVALHYNRQHYNSLWQSVLPRSIIMGFCNVTNYPPPRSRQSVDRQPVIRERNNDDCLMQPLPWWLSSASEAANCSS